jgi:hypothetical protein
MALIHSARRRCCDATFFALVSYPRYVVGWLRNQFVGRDYCNSAARADAKRRVSEERSTHKVTRREPKSR